MISTRIDLPKTAKIARPDNRMHHTSVRTHSIGGSRGSGAAWHSTVAQ